MTEQAKVPAIRFAGFTDPWEQRELVDIAEIVGGGTPDTNNSNYWDGDIDWYAPAELGNNIYAESSTRKITQAGFDSCSTKMLPADKTILFTSRAGIGNTAILRHSACTNQGFQSLVIGDADVYFVYSMSERIKKWAEEKASGSTFLEISGRQLETMPVNLPSLVEQQAIGSFFSHLDDLITLHQRKYDKLVVFKKSMLEKMFPKDGESVPEIRLAGFTDPCEQRKLGDVADLLTGYPFESRHFTDTGIPLVRGMNVKRGYLDMSADICENWSDAAGVEDYLLKAGDIVIQMDGALIGSSYAMVTPENTPSLLVQRVTRVRCGNRSRYIFQAVQRGFLRYIKSLKTETAVPHLSLSDIADYAIPVPKEEREQEHIGSFFSRLDDLITLHQRKLELLQNIKKSLLDKMFV